MTVPAPREMKQEGEKQRDQRSLSARRNHDDVQETVDGRRLGGQRQEPAVRGDVRDDHDGGDG